MNHKANILMNSKPDVFDSCLKKLKVIEREI